MKPGVIAWESPCYEIKLIIGQGTEHVNELKNYFS